MLADLKTMEVGESSSTRGIFGVMEDHEQVVYFYDKETGLKAIVAIHDSTLGPAVGGTRVWAYQREEDALRDVLRLSRGMTYKSSLAGLNFGGGKAVIIGAGDRMKGESLLRVYGRYLHALGGRYWTAEDMNMTPEEMRYIRMETPYVLGLSKEMGGSGDPSPVTAYGVYVALRASCKRLYGSESLSGRRVVLQGLGKVGMRLLEHISKEGAKALVYDVNEQRVREAVKKHRATALDSEESVYTAEADIYMPCAMGGVINERTVAQFNCGLIAGAANNQLAEESCADLLRERGILYAPDFLINSGGIINVYYEYQKCYSQELSFRHLEGMYKTLGEVYLLSEKRGISTHQAAMDMSRARIMDMRKIAHK